MGKNFDIGLASTVFCYYTLFLIKKVKDVDEYDKWSERNWRQFPSQKTASFQTKRLVSFSVYIPR
jgi:hypothetical protein